MATITGSTPMPSHLTILPQVSLLALWIACGYSMLGVAVFHSRVPAIDPADPKMKATGRWDWCIFTTPGCQVPSILQRRIDPSCAVKNRHHRTAPSQLGQWLNWPLCIHHFSSASSSRFCRRFITLDPRRHFDVAQKASANPWSRIFETWTNRMLSLVFPGYLEQCLSQCKVADPWHQIMDCPLCSSAGRYSSVCRTEDFQHGLGVLHYWGPVRTRNKWIDNRKIFGNSPRVCLLVCNHSPPLSVNVWCMTGWWTFSPQKHQFYTT